MVRSRRSPDDQAAADALLAGTGRPAAAPSINGQIAIRPPLEDFAEWAAGGCAGWSPRDVLPYFVRLEDDEVFGDESYHGRSGPTPIYRTPQAQWGAVDTALSSSAQAAGFGWAADVNAPGATGVSPYPINSRDGRRVSVNDAYLEPARSLAPTSPSGAAHWWSGCSSTGRGPPGSG